MILWLQEYELHESMMMDHTSWNSKGYYSDAPKKNGNNNVHTVKRINFVDVFKGTG